MQPLDCELQSLPTFIGGLKKLIYIGISNYGVKELAKDFGELHSLVGFNARICSSSSRLPKSFDDF